MSADGDSTGEPPDLFRSEALAHRYRKRWGSLVSQASGRVRDSLLLAAAVLLITLAVERLVAALGWGAIL